MSRLFTSTYCPSSKFRKISDNCAWEAYAITNAYRRHPEAHAIVSDWLCLPAQHLCYQPFREATGVSESVRPREVGWFVSHVNLRKQRVEDKLSDSDRNHDRQCGGKL